MVKFWTSFFCGRSPAGRGIVSGTICGWMIRIRLGHESLDVTLAYLKGEDAESEEAQENANSSSLALYV
jgi:hypothetical protein